jgi:amino acid adenylation domain-containing protein/non-ribosomal peptide synthase protein (TIGR01720 family)
MLGHLATLLTAMPDHVGRTVQELPVLTDAERRQLLRDWNDTAAVYPQKDLCLHQLIEEQAGRTPDRVAVQAEEGSLSYRELEVRANQLSHTLRGLGVGPGVLVGIAMERSLEMVVGLLGILKAGGAYVPLDPTYPKDRLAFMMDDSRVPVLLTQDRLRASLPAHEAQVLALDTDWSAIARESSAPACSAITCDDLAYMIYTSGSTGKPKGAMNAHRGIVNQILWRQDAYGLDADDRVLQKTPCSFDVSVWEFFLPLSVGARLVMARPDGHKDPAYLVQTIVEQGITTLHFVPPMLQVFLEHESVRSCISLRRVLSSGEALTAELRDRFYERLGCELHNLYGPTEAAIDVTYLACRRDERSRVVPIGRPVANTQIYVLDRHLEPVPIGVAGELHIGGVQVGPGYLNRPELTAERFIPDPFGGAGARLYKTGDLARFLPDGNVEYLGRMDHQVKIRGFRIELGEIESAISLHPLVRESIVLAREDSPGDRRLVAYVAADTDRLSIVEELRTLLRSKLPEYMVPPHFVLLASLPLAPNGKIDRAALPAPEIGRGELSKPYAAPQTPTEETMARIWSAVLGVERVGTADNFFELGGDSILSIQVIAKCRSAGLLFTPRDLFKTPTIAGLSQGLALASPIVTTDDGIPSGSVPLTPIQHWFFEQEMAESDHWNQAFVFQVPPGIDVDLLEEALHRVVLHHDALRLRYRMNGAEWRQEYGPPPASTPIVRVDLSALPEQDRALALSARATSLQARLSMTEGPLLRSAHFEWGVGQPGRFLLAIHHLVVDGVSWRILIEDLESVYVSLRDGATVDLPQRTTSYKRWSEKLTAHVTADVSARALEQWRRIVSDGDATSLPRDHEGADNVEGRARTLSVSLDAAETQDLLQRVPGVYRTQINDALLTALGEALTRCTSPKSCVVELEGHGREDLFEGVDLSRTVGWFTTIYPFRLERDALDPGTALISTKERLRQVPDRGLSYGLLRYMGNEESRVALRAHPQPDLIFNYLGQFDQIVAGSSLFRFARESPGPWHSPRARRRHALEVMTLVQDGRLQARFIFSEELHKQDTIERLANAFVDSLRRLVRHCKAATLPRFTPSDFPLARVDEASLQTLAREHPAIEDLYALSPMQSLFYSMHGMASAVGLEEWRFEIRGALQPGPFRRAWEHLLERHAMLRTAFTTPAFGETLQIVEKSVNLPWREEDLRGRSAEEQETRIQALAGLERIQGFDLARAPLLRLTLVRLAEEHYELLWTTHHLYIDGWSWPVVFREVASNYAALRAGALPPSSEACSYGRYIRWLSQRTVNSEAFWKAELAGLREPTPLDLGFSDPRNEGPAEEVLALSPAETELLQSLARQQQVTLSAVIQAAWALLLSHYSGAEDIVFGAAFSGRPPELLGIEGLIGPCVNNVPVRARVALGEPAVSMAMQLQQRQPELSAHQYVPLAQIQSWTGVPLRLRLFDSLIVFQNYIVDEGARQLGGDARIRLVVGPDATNYSITLVVVPGPDLRFKLLWHRNHFSRTQGTTMLRDLWTILEAMGTQPDATVASVLARLPVETRGRAATVAAQRQPRSTAAYVAPLGQMEEVVATIWRELFEVERIGMDDNFFDLGGHSLLLVRAHQRLVNEVRADLPIAALFQNPTARSLARYLSGTSGNVGNRATKERAQKQREALARMSTAKGKR